MNVYKANLIIPIRVVAEDAHGALQLAKSAAREVRADIQWNTLYQVMDSTYVESHAQVTREPISKDVRYEA